MVRSKDLHNDQSLDESCLWKRGNDSGEAILTINSNFQIRTASSVIGSVSISVLKRELGSSYNSHYITCLINYLKMQILGQDWESAFLTRSQVMAVMLVCDYKILVMQLQCFKVRNRTWVLWLWVCDLTTLWHCCLQKFYQPKFEF